MAGGFGSFLRALCLTFGLFAAAGCTVVQDAHGYAPDDSLLSDVTVGLDTKATVERLIGRPGTEGVVGTDRWYYVRSDYERFLWRAPKETKREVVVVSFDKKGVVTNIERFGLDKGEVVPLSRRVTESNIKGMGFLRQLFGNIGGLSADQVLNNGN